MNKYLQALLIVHCSLLIEMSVWLTIAGMALATFAIRALPMLTLHGTPPPWLDRALRYVPPAIFAALVVPALLAPDGRLAAGPHLWAGLLGAVVAFRTRNMALTIAAGLLAYALFRVWL